MPRPVSRPGVGAEQHLAGRGIPHRRTVGREGAALVRGPDLEAGAGRVDVGHVHGVAVPEAHVLAGSRAARGQDVERAVEQAAVVVDGRGAVDDLVLAVAVDVGSAQRVEALRGDRRVLGVGAVAAVGQSLNGFVIGTWPLSTYQRSFRLLAVPVVRRDRGARVVAAGEHGRRVLAVEVARHPRGTGRRGCRARCAPSRSRPRAGRRRRDRACSRSSRAPRRWRSRTP